MNRDVFGGFKVFSLSFGVLHCLVLLSVLLFFYPLKNSSKQEFGKTCRFQMKMYAQLGLI